MPVVTSTAPASESGRYVALPALNLGARLLRRAGQAPPLQRMEEDPLLSHPLAHGGLAWLKPGAYICCLHPAWYFLEKHRGRFGRNC